ncbi:translation elongation factor Ts [Patescibacteria group bacterium]|nr:translation elongation factor Ts [Patescibacteria group bacterium]MBU1931607.1 translation elongation factor Ts [Patescibacteria group bacterium]
MNIKQIKQLRDETGVGIMEAKKALEEAQGDLLKAKKILKERGLVKAKKKADRDTAEGRVQAYIHGEGRVGALIELSCETDFVAKNEAFVQLANEIGMQVAAMDAKDVKALLAQDYIRDSSKKISDLIHEAVAKLGENIVICRFERFEVGN